MAHIIYKVIGQNEWQELRKTGCYHGSAVDLKDGYIHFSTADQLRETLMRHFAGEKDLVLLAIDVDALPEESVKWEKARGDQLFPHLYAPLSLDAVCESWPLHLDENDVHILPSEFA